jgi:hypothetical protein
MSCGGDRQPAATLGTVRRYWLLAEALDTDGGQGWPVCSGASASDVAPSIVGLHRGQIR